VRSTISFCHSVWVRASRGSVRSRGSPASVSGCLRRPLRPHTSLRMFGGDGATSFSLLCVRAKQRDQRMAKDGAGISTPSHFLCRRARQGLRVTHHGEGREGLRGEGGDRCAEGHLLRGERLGLHGFADDCEVREGARRQDKGGHVGQDSHVLPRAR
jgi:hypothetical protein